MAHRKLGYLVIAIGLCYLVFSLFGFVLISDDSTVGGGLRGGNPPDLLWGVFGVSTVHNFVNILLGAVTLVGGFTFPKSRLITACAAIGFALVTVYGVIAMLVRGNAVDPLSITWGDNILHLVTALILGVLATAVKERSRTEVH